MRIFFDALIFVTIGLTALFVYISYWDDIRLAVFGEESKYTLFVSNVPVIVTVADTPETQAKGLSGVTKLGTNEGKFFVFDHAGKHGMWMKDMFIPLDILWISDTLEVVHIERVVTPETFPTVFAPPSDARFVLEVNAHLTDTLKLEVGDRIFVPPELLPADIRETLQD